MECFGQWSPIHLDVDGILNVLRREIRIIAQTRSFKMASGSNTFQRKLGEGMKTIPYRPSNGSEGYD